MTIQLETEVNRTWGELMEWAEATNAAAYSPPPSKITAEEWNRDISLAGDGDTAEETEDDVANMFARVACSNLLYIPQMGAWAYWNGSRWKVDEASDAAVVQRLRYWLEKHYCPKIVAIAQSRYDDYAAWKASNGDPIPEKQQNKDKRKIESSKHQYWRSATRINNLLKLVKSDQRFITPLTAFDADPEALNTPGGLVDLRTGLVSPPDPKALCLRSTTVAPDFNAPAPKWHAFLNETFSGDGEVITYIQRMLGVSLLGAQTEQVSLYLHGSGRNGKGVLMNVATGLIGEGETGYSVQIASDVLVEKRSNSHPTELAQLAGARMVTTSEIAEGAQLDAAKFKTMTGGDKLSARFMRQDFFSFKATFTLWIMANARLQVSAQDDAVFRRLREVPFLHTVAPGKEVQRLDEVLIHDEGPAILAWMIQGAVDYLREGLVTPQLVIQATADNRAEQDSVSEWVQSSCKLEGGSFEYIQSLRKAYAEYCQVTKKKQVSDEDFKKVLENKHGLRYVRRKEGMGFVGIGLPFIL